MFVVVGFFQKVFGGLLGFSDVSLVCCIAIPAHVHCFVVLSCCGVTRVYCCGLFN